VIYDFGEPGKSDDGARPRSALRAVHGRLYGTTQFGGTTNARCPLGCGTVFSVDASGKERVIYRFKGGNDGAAPLAGVIVDGVLYGTTSAGGGAGACQGGCGTVFKVNTSGTSEAVLHAFAGGTDGAVPAAPLVRLGGILYGTTQSGGRITHLCPSGCGTVFSIHLQGSERVIYRFGGGKDGANPIASLHAYRGQLYGTTQYGGATTSFCATGCGTVFKISTAGVRKTLHAFTYASSSKDGAFPAAGIVVLGGKLYGTTFGGGRYGEGTVFEVNPSSGSERVVHAFGNNTDGQFPQAGLTVVNAILFGTTLDGGISGKGTVFEVRPSGAETVLHDFGGKPDGAMPSAAVTSFGSKLYGTTGDAGARSEGTVFAMAPVARGNQGGLWTLPEADSLATYSERKNHEAPGFVDTKHGGVCFGARRGASRFNGATRAGADGRPQRQTRLLVHDVLDGNVELHADAAR
jgi:uncharacterized repeat protein (TIGR03803 family)